MSQNLNPPPRWINCPKKGQIITDLFLPMKTPLNKLFNKNLNEENRFNTDSIFKYAEQEKLKIGLWIDLTNTTNFYNYLDIQKLGAEYYKLACRGFGQAPSEEQTQNFIQKVSIFTAKHPKEIVVVHCTHGYNRTGFLISSYLIDQLSWGAQAAIENFKEARPPGIYKQDYLNELFLRYDDIIETPMASERPDWDLDVGPENDDFSFTDFDNPTKNNSENEAQKTNFVMVDDTKINGIELMTNKDELNPIKQMCKTMCDFRGKAFPGSQPVSMTIQNIELLSVKPYKVSWKADGMRYMMLIHGNLVCLIDRDNRYYKVHNINFPRRKEPDKSLENTLLDGEMVIDKVEGRAIPRYLIYDIIVFESKQVGQMSFDIRLICIEKEIINSRNNAIQSGLFDKAQEPFAVRAKPFYTLTETKKLWTGNFSKLLSHEMDGLVFQPVPDPYKMGRWEEVLKWKPPEMNSIDFKLKIVKESNYGMLPEYKGYLYVGGYDKPMAQIKVTKDLKKYNDKIIECKVEGNHWKFMRERTDKSFPNHISTVKGVWESIVHPVTAEYLFNYIAQCAYLQSDRDYYHRTTTTTNISDVTTQKSILSTTKRPLTPEHNCNHNPLDEPHATDTKIFKPSI